MILSVMFGCQPSPVSTLPPLHSTAIPPAPYSYSYSAPRYQPPPLPPSKPAEPITVEGQLAAIQALVRARHQILSQEDSGAPP